MIQKPGKREEVGM